MARYSYEYGRYPDAYRRYPYEFRRRRRRGRLPAEGRYAAGFGYGRIEYGRGGYGEERARGYGAEYRGFVRRGRVPGKPAHGYPVRGIHTYDLDYGDLAGPTTEYSGRAGYTEDRDWVETPRGPYTPRLVEIGRQARLRRRLYGPRGPTYSGPGRRGRGWR